ncbi:exocyst subunit exo70 family protein G1 [Actinidia rufa]|uniref:Exocyst subunit Exo70 family protein n=1 Tax=Actinidia rufa TaxID=165716 RepID=A0A7J0GBV6_9ERIC|nr:exocyst subunit exo70 family protein G1 [Actinidia rufa]
MAESGSIENLVAVRRLLKSSLEKSRDIASEINKTGHIDRAIGPATSVLKVFDAVHGIEGLLLSDPSSNLFGYLSLVKQLEEALKFLTDNCGLVIQWLEDVVRFLEDNTIDDDWYLLTVRKSLMILGQLQAMENSSLLNGGSLFAALEKLESEFKHLLVENSFPMDFTLTSGGNEASHSAPPIPVAVIQKLQAILERIKANNRIEKCITIYVEVRSSKARATMQALDLNYLEISISEFESVQSIEDYIDQWGNHLEFAVKHLFELEYRLSNDVFQKAGSEVWMSCFADIAIQSGIHGFIKFANTVTKGKKDAIKLLKLLDIFASLNRLRLNFNRLFGGKACVEIQTQTRDLIKKVVDGACGIFWELSVQVDLQKQCTPPSDGSVPRLVSFVTDYCNQLLEDDYRLILTQVLEIHQGWNHEKFEEGFLSNEVNKIMSVIEQNLETWAKRYENTALSYLFMMNTHWYLFKHLQGTNLGNLMGDSWLRCHEQRTEYYAAAFLRESWGKLTAFLHEEGLILFSGGTAVACDLVKKRLKAFSEAFDDIYKQQSNWVVLDKSLRLRICQLVVHIIVPVYRRFMQSHMPLVEQGTSPNKYVKYSADSLENMISSLFQQKLGQYGSTKCTHLIGKIKNVVTNHFSSTPAAA